MTIGECIISVLLSACLILLININCKEVTPVDAKAQRIRAIVVNFPISGFESMKIRENLIEKILEEE